MEKNKKIKVVITCGDAAGIGYEVIFKALRKIISKKQMREARFLLIGDKCAADFALKHLKRKLDFNIVKDAAEIDWNKKINFLDMRLIKNFSLRKAGRVNITFGKASLKYVEKAYELIKEKKCDCMVTAPVNKKAVCLYEKNFTGHTEFLAGLSKTKQITMMLAGEKLKVVLVTRHISLKEVSAALNKDDIVSSTKLTDNYLKKFRRSKNPKIALCALNPHAGENGVLGDEERKIIIPAAKSARAEKINLTGPESADAVFEKAYRGEYEAVVCLYHDQGLIPLKMIEREAAVNITLGLPFVRTSPAHGTAFDIAYQNKADSTSFYFAVKKAVEMTRNIKLKPQ